MECWGPPPRGAPARPSETPDARRVPPTHGRSSLTCPPVGSSEEMLALRDLFGYPFRGLFGAAHQPPAARAVAIANFRRSRHAADQAPTRDSKLSDAVLGTKGLRPELRGDRRQLQLQLARHGARAPEQPRAQGLHQALVQREPRDRDPP